LWSLPVFSKLTENEGAEVFIYSDKIFISAHIIIGEGLMSDEFDWEDDDLGEDEWFSDSEDNQLWLYASDLGTPLDRRKGGTRRHIRINTVIAPGQTRAFTGDISISGMLIYSPVPLRVGEVVELTIQTDSGRAYAGGVVRWSHKPHFSQNMLEDTANMGVQFTWVSLKLRNLLEECLGHLTHFGDKKD